MDIETAYISQPAPTPMVVDSPSLPDETWDYYTVDGHIMMDEKAEAALRKARVRWQENPS